MSWRGCDTDDGITSNGDAFILMYSVDLRRSYEGLETLYQSILRVKGELQTTLVLVGNKCDDTSGRAVSTREGMELAEQFGCRYFETSAKSGKNVKVAVGRLIQQFMQASPDTEAESSLGGQTQRTTMIFPVRTQQMFVTLKNKLRFT